MVGLSPNARITVLHDKLPQANASRGTLFASAANLQVHRNVMGHVVRRVMSDFACKGRGQAKTCASCVAKCSELHTSLHVFRHADTRGRASRTRATFLQANMVYILDAFRRSYRLPIAKGASSKVGSEDREGASFVIKIIFFIS